jgi:hypothetical protein
MSSSQNRNYQNAIVMCRGGGEQKRNYMTVNLSLIIGHIRKLRGAFSQGNGRAGGVGGKWPSGYCGRCCAFGNLIRMIYVLDAKGNAC